MRPEDTYDGMRDKVLTEIRDHFKLVLNRPEILNRIGENIIVFDFVRQDVGEQIFAQMLASILDDLKAKGYAVTLDEAAQAHMKAECLRDLSNGGRGIRNQLETLLINPLARQLFDDDVQPGEPFLLSYSSEAGRLERGR